MKLSKYLSILLAVPMVLTGCDLFKKDSGGDEPTPAPSVTNYSVAFEANGGTGEMANMTTSGSTFVVPLCTFTYEGHSFNKWALGRSSGTQYSVGETISGISSDIILFALWTDDGGVTPQTNYTVTFMANGGHGEMADGTTNGSSYTLPECGFQRNGFKFVKWALGSASGTQYAAGTTLSNITSNITLYAIWEEDTSVPGTEEATAYAEAFQSLKTAITSGHNYTITVHSYIEGYEDDEECVFDSEYVMIDDEIYYWDTNYFGGKRGYIKQANQGFVNFSYYPLTDQFNTDGFFSTRTDAGIHDMEDAIGENLFIGSYTQDSTNVSKFSTDSIDVMAVAANLSWDRPDLLEAPEDVHFIVSEDKSSLTLHTTFHKWHFDEKELYLSVIGTFEIHDIGTTSEAFLEAYVDNPSETFVVPTNWSASQNELFETYYAGVSPTFISGLSYSLDVFQKDDEGKHKVLLQDFGSGDRTEAYATQLVENELFTEFDTEGSNRLFKRTDVDGELMSQVTYVVDMSFISPSQEVSFGQVSRRYPNGIFQVFFYGIKTNIGFTTIQQFNEYIAVNGYTQFVPQFDLDPSTTISRFSDVTEKTNTESGHHDYEFLTASQSMRIHIADYAAAQAAVSSYASALALMGFEPEGVNPLTKQRSYFNNDDYTSPSYVAMSELSEQGITSANYDGYVYIRYQIYALKDPSDLPVLTKIEIENPKTDFVIGEAFSFGSGKVRAQYSDGDNKLVTESVVFDQYDMSVSGDQTVRVTYSEGDIVRYAYYTIHVASNVNYATTTFKVSGDDTTLTLNLCADGTGTYICKRVGTSSSAGTFVQYFTYVISGSTITFTLSRTYNTSEFTKLSLFMNNTVGGEGSVRVGTYTESEHKIEVETSTTSTDETHNQHALRTFILQ